MVLMHYFFVESFYFLKAQQIILSCHISRTTKAKRI